MAFAFVAEQAAGGLAELGVNGADEFLGVELRLRHCNKDSAGLGRRIFRLGVLPRFALTSMTTTSGPPAGF